jgi:hypothetical protein
VKSYVFSVDSNLFVHTNFADLMFQTIFQTQQVELVKKLHDMHIQVLISVDAFYFFDYKYTCINLIYLIQPALCFLMTDHLIKPLWK